MPSSEFGYARTLSAATQQDALKTLAKLTLQASIDPTIRATALKIVRDCASRDDKCELEAIFNAVKFGDPDVRPLRNGFKYVADPRFSDYFTDPRDSLRSCIKGACAGDCDDHTALVAALLSSIGWQAGLRAWGPSSGSEFVHVYPVVAFPKRPPYSAALGLDTTVDESEVGWEPPKGRVLTAWLE